MITIREYVIVDVDADFRETGMLPRTWRLEYPDVEDISINRRSSSDCVLPFKLICSNSEGEREYGFYYNVREKKLYLSNYDKAVRQSLRTRVEYPIEVNQVYCIGTQIYTSIISALESKVAELEKEYTSRVQSERELNVSRKDTLLIGWEGVLVSSTRTDIIFNISSLHMTSEGWTAFVKLKVSGIGDDNAFRCKYYPFTVRGVFWNGDFELISLILQHENREIHRIFWWHSDCFEYENLYEDIADKVRKQIQEKVQSTIQYRPTF